MDVTGWIAHLDRNGRVMADAAESAGTEAAVPTCPDWTVRDLLAHAGMVHRWATRHVREGRAAPIEADHPAPDGDAVLPWFRDGHAALVEALTAAPDDLDALIFLAGAGAPREFWARRQAHETTVHCADAVIAADGVPPEVDHDLAVDGIGELVDGFFARPRTRLRSETPVTLGIVTDDADTSWRLLIGPDATTSERDTATSATAADCTVTGRAADLYLDLWNRPPRGAVTVVGDGAVMALWRDLARVTWS